MSEIICKCKKIDEATIVAAIKEGAHTIEELKEKTKATAGCCKGHRCKAEIETLISQHK